MRKLSYRFEDLGEKSVKNIAQPIRVYRLNFGAVGSEAPDPGNAGGVENTVTAGEAPSPIALLSDPQEIDQKSTELVFWNSVKDSALCGDYEAYLDQFPDGVFVSLARARLEDLSSDESVIRAPRDEKVELLFWESVRNSDNPLSLRAYLERFPDGEFKPLAEIRLVELDSESKQ